MISSELPLVGQESMARYLVVLLDDNSVLRGSSDGVSDEVNVADGGGGGICA